MVDPTIVDIYTGFHRENHNAHTEEEFQDGKTLGSIP